MVFFHYYKSPLELNHTQNCIRVKRGEVSGGRHHHPQASLEYDVDTLLIADILLEVIVGLITYIQRIYL
jgi:hypothetical protein